MSTTTRAPHRVLLVREWDQQVGSSGCCGRLNSASVDAVNPAAESPYAHARVRMEAVGRVYTTLRGAFGEDEVDVTVVDPRNFVWLVPTVWRDARRRGLSTAAALRACHRATATGVLVCDGRVLGRDLTAEQALDAVRADLAS